MRKIILMGDIFFHSSSYLNKQSLFVQRLFLPIIKSVIEENIEITFEIKNKKQEVFSREYFFKLGNVTTLKEKYQEYDINNFNNEQLEYLGQFFNTETIIIGFELYDKLVDLLTSFGCKIIDFAFHSFKLFEDLPFAINSNDIEVYNVLNKYKIPNEKFYFYANYWKIFLEQNKMINDKDIANNSVLFIGQTLTDKSVEKEGIFLNITHFEKELKELSKKYSKVYYLPHPYLGVKRKEIYDWIKKSPYVELIANQNTYSLLSSNKINKVVGISTSVLYEAQFFNKEIEYLYKPLFNIDVPFEEHSYVSVLDDYWNPKFWAEVLCKLCPIKQNVKDINYLAPAHNKIRNIQNLYWGYRDLDPIKRIPNFEESIKRLYAKYIAPHF